MVRDGEGHEALTKTASDRCRKGWFKDSGRNLWEVGGGGVELFIDLSSMAAPMSTRINNVNRLMDQ